MEKINVIEYETLKKEVKQFINWININKTSGYDIINEEIIKKFRQNNKDDKNYIQIIQMIQITLHIQIIIFSKYV